VVGADRSLLATRHDTRFLSKDWPHGTEVRALAFGTSALPSVVPVLGAGFEPA
jgi:hypothetical protein